MGADPAVRELDTILRERLPQTDIVDVIADTVRALDLQRFFRPISGDTARSQVHPVVRTVALAFCYGRNTGATQVQRSFKIFNRRQVAGLDGRWGHRLTEPSACEAAPRQPLPLE